MPGGHSVHPHLCQGDLCTGQGPQEPLARRLLRGARRLALVEAGDGRLGVLQSMPCLRFEQGQQAQRQGQEAGQALALIVLPDEQRTEAHQEVFDQMEVLFPRPAVAAVLYRLQQGQPGGRGIRDPYPPAQPLWCARQEHH